MEFYTQFKEKRPVRLSEETRKFAYESLCEFKYGLDTMKVMAVDMDHIPGFSDMSELDKYDKIVTEIVNKAPIRICEGEKISGAATLGDASYHKVPTHYKGEMVVFGVSQLTI